MTVLRFVFSIIFYLFFILVVSSLTFLTSFEFFVFFVFVKVRTISYAQTQLLWCFKLVKGEKVLVTGGAGFIGSHLVDALVEENEVIIIDDLSCDEKFINPKSTFIEASVSDCDFSNVLDDVDRVFHLAANSNVREKDPKTHMNDNFFTTLQLLEGMRENDVRKIVFASSSTVYGEADVPTFEDHPTFPISLYGASKLASEGLISSYCHTFDFDAWVYRFANVIGSRLRRGVIFDFINKLREDSEELEILGNGEQKKSYIYIDDCIDAMLTGLKIEGGFNVFNIGTSDQVKVTRIAEIVSEEMGLDPGFEYTGGKRGWKGDVPDMLLAAEKLKSLGWDPVYGSEEAVRNATRDLLDGL